MGTVTTKPLVPASRARLMRAATYASVAVALVLIALKSAAWLMTDSVAILSSLADSWIDAAASLVTLFAVRHALTPADDEHRFGHGKAEALAGLGQAALIVASVGFLVIKAVDRLIEPAPVENGLVGIAVMAIAIVLTFGLVQFQRYVVRRTDSVAVAADSLHYKSDLLMNLAVAAALALSVSFGWHTLDPIFAVGVALYIVVGAWTILHNSLDLLMDREFPPDERRKIQDIALAHPDVRAAHDLRTRSSGTRVFIQLHLELDGNLTLHRAHHIADEVEAEIQLVFPDAEVMIHQDPAGLVEDHPRFL
jgi:ferrous-iron efflux pump FieF